MGWRIEGLRASRTRPAPRCTPGIAAEVATVLLVDHDVNRHSALCLHTHAVTAGSIRTSPLVGFLGEAHAYCAVRPCAQDCARGHGNVTFNVRDAHRDGKDKDVDHTRPQQHVLRSLGPAGRGQYAHHSATAGSQEACDSQTGLGALHAPARAAAADLHASEEAAEVLRGHPKQAVFLPNVGRLLASQLTLRLWRRDRIRDASRREGTAPGETEAVRRLEG